MQQVAVLEGSKRAFSISSREMETRRNTYHPFSDDCNNETWSSLADAHLVINAVTAAKLTTSSTNQSQVGQVINIDC